MPTISKIAASAALVLVAVGSAQAQAKPQCRTFKEIYGNEANVPGGKKLCEKMWSSAFKYELDEDKAYTMWFFDKVNPNDAVTERLDQADPTLFDGKGHEDASATTGDYDTGQCHLDYFHKDVPSKEGDSLTVCAPWKEKGCCKPETVRDTVTIKEAYGKEFHWDRCGKLSPQCEAYFIYEACFYECEPNAGLWRKHPKHVFDTDADGNVIKGNEDDHNAWQMSQMPIKASFCDQFYTACQNDKFCASDEGDFFSCAAEYEAADDASKGMKPHIIAAIVVPVVVACLACVFMIVMMRKERAGQPMFQPIDRNDARASGEGGGV